MPTLIITTNPNGQTIDMYCCSFMHATEITKTLNEIEPNNIVKTDYEKDGKITPVYDKVNGYQ